MQNGYKKYTFAGVEKLCYNSNCLGKKIAQCKHCKDFLENRLSTPILGRFFLLLCAFYKII